MDKESKAATDCEAQEHEEHQDRRQFFNGLGKWSLAIVAAVSSLAGDGTRVQAGTENAPKADGEPERPAWTVPEDSHPRQKMAGYFKRRPHGDYTKTHNEHADFTAHGDGTRIQ